MRLLLVFLFVLLNTLVLGQSREIDSLKSAVNNLNGEAKIDALLKLARAYQSHSLRDLEFYASEADSLSDNIDYEKGKAGALTLLSVYNAFTGYHDLSLEQQLEALQIFERLNDKPNVAKVLHNTGGIYFYLREYNKSIDFLLRSIAIRKELEDTLNVGVSEMSICAAYNFKNQPDSGKIYCEDGLRIMKRYNIPGRLAEAYLYVAQNLTLRKQYAEANSAYKHAISFVEKGNFQGTAVELYNDLGSYYLELGKYDSAAYCLHKTLSLLKTYNDRSSLIHTYELLSKKHELTHRYDSSLYYFKLHSKANNENFNVQKSLQIASLQAQYDVKNKDKELELNRQRLNTQRSIITAISIILFILIILGYFILRIYLAKKKANEELQQLYNTIQEKNEEIVAQSEELQEANNTISQMNQDLESIVHERTEKIAVQHAKLIEYAYFNAHKVRGPLARILGLVKLTRMEVVKDEIEDIHARIEISAQELDDVIHEINSKLEKDDSE